MSWIVPAERLEILKVLPRGALLTRSLSIVTYSPVVNAAFPVVREIPFV
jgi:hypothetical protein